MVDDKAVGLAILATALGRMGETAPKWMDKRMDLCGG